MILSQTIYINIIRPKWMRKKFDKELPLQLAYNFVFEESRISDEYPLRAYFPAYGIENFGFGMPLYRSYDLLRSHT